MNNEFDAITRLVSAAAVAGSRKVSHHLHHINVHELAAFMLNSSVLSNENRT